MPAPTGRQGSVLAFDYAIDRPLVAATPDCVLLTGLRFRVAARA
jgi:hypothetical protein